METYVPWNLHEPTPGTFDFTSELLDVVSFINACNDEGLSVIVRPSPYICAGTTKYV